MEIFKIEASLKPTLRKVQDFFSTKAVGERLDIEVLRGIRADHALVENTVNVFIKNGVLGEEDAQICPNTGCGLELKSKDEFLYCEDCDENIDPDHAAEARLLVISEKIDRTLDVEWFEADDGQENFLVPKTGEVIKGERDGHHVYLVKELSDLGPQAELQNGASLLRLGDHRFQPEYGLQRRRHVYSYIELKGTITMNQNVHFNGNNNSVGNISQHNETVSSGTSNEAFLALIGSIQKAASENNVRDERLIRVLESAMTGGSNGRGIIETLNRLVSLAADYSTIIGPFVPQITAMMAAFPVV